MDPKNPTHLTDYNSQPAKPKYDFVKFLKEPDGTYSYYWPLVIVFLAFIFLFVYEVSYLRYRKLIETEQLSHFTGLGKAVKDQTEFALGMQKDMEILAPTHPDVDAILKEYFPDSPVNATSKTGTSTPASK